ncbi:hypothetical protein [Thiothrix subterranea]|nr:hypothetical protein [Thiothrix subterranea]
MTTYTFIYDINGIADFEERVLKASLRTPCSSISGRIGVARAYSLIRY